MRLHDQMDDAVSDVTADLTALAASARTAGSARRRRTRALTTLAAAAAVTAIVGGAVALQSGAGPRPDGPTIASEPTSSPSVLSGETAPITGRATVAALMAAVDQVADGELSHPSGSDLLDFDPSTLGDNQLTAAVDLTVEGGETGEVFANVQSYTGMFLERDQPKCERGDDDCVEGRSQALPDPDECVSFMEQCEVTRLGGGDVLRTYRDSVSTEGEVRTVAELVSVERDLRLLVSATNGVLGVDDLATVVRQPWWDREELPVEYAEAGAALEGYDDDGGAIDEVTEAPSPGE